MKTLLHSLSVSPGPPRSSTTGPQSEQAQPGGPTGSASPPFLAFPKEVRKHVHTTKALESLNFQLLKVLKTKGHVPSGEAVAKPMSLALRNIEVKWKRPSIFWSNAISYFVVLFADRMPA